LERFLFQLIPIEKNSLMKKIIPILILLVAAVVNAQKINWMTMNDAIAAQEKQPKKILVDVYTNWCGPCKLLDRNTFSNTDVAAYINEHFYAVKFNAEGNETVSINDQTFTNPNFNPSKTAGRNSVHQFTRFMKVNAYPTMLFIESDGTLITNLKGYRTPQQLEPFLKLYSTDLWKTLDTQEKFDRYTSSFKNKFNG
jgi:thioredoxin-related protein